MENKQIDLSEDRNKDQDTSETKHATQVHPTLMPINYREDDRSKKRLPIGKKINILKPMMIAIFSAILVGSILGFFMLNMFTNLGEDIESHSQEPTNVHANPVDKADHTVSAATLEGMRAFVLQGGVFSKAENADEWALKFQQATIPTVVFEKDQQHYLFVGIASTENEAKKLAKTVTDQQFEVYVKEWKSEDVELELTAEEQHWLESFQKQWKDTLQLIHTGEEVSLEGWDDLVNSHPLESERVLQLVDNIHTFYDKDSDEHSHFEWQAMLLSTWKIYENMINQEDDS